MNALKILMYVALNISFIVTEKLWLFWHNQYNRILGDRKTLCIFTNLETKKAPAKLILCECTEGKIYLKRAQFIGWTDKKYFLENGTLLSFFQLLKSCAINSSLCPTDGFQSKNPYGIFVILTTHAHISSTEVALKRRV